MKLETKNHFMDVADLFDRFRLFPIIMLAGYGWFVFEVFIWIKSLNQISIEAAGIFSAVIGTAGFVFNFYTNLITREKSNV